MCGVKRKGKTDLGLSSSSFITPQWHALRCHLPPYFWGDGSLLPSIALWHWTQTHQFWPKMVPHSDGHAPRPKLPLKDTSQGLSLILLTRAEVRVPNLGSSNAWSEWKESSHGNSPPAQGISPHQLRAHCPAQLTTSAAGPSIHPALHPSEPGPCERSPQISAAAFTLPKAANWKWSSCKFPGLNSILYLKQENKF